MANSDIIKIGFDYRASLAQFEKDTNGVFDGISNKAGKQRITIQLDAKDDKVIDKIKELQKLKLDKFTFEFGDSGLKEQLQTFDKLENKINEIINLGKGKSFIDSSPTVTDIGKIENKINELNKKYEEAQKKLSSIGSGDISGKDVNLVDNAEFQKLTQEVSKLKNQFDDLKIHIQLLDDCTVPTDRFFELQSQVEGATARVSDLVDEFTKLSNAQKVLSSTPQESNISSGSNKDNLSDLQKQEKLYVRMANDSNLIGKTQSEIRQILIEEDKNGDSINKDLKDRILLLEKGRVISELSVEQHKELYQTESLVGKSKQDVLSLIQKENAEIAKGNRLFRERMIYFKDGKVVQENIGDSFHVSDTYTKSNGADEFLHIHPEGKLNQLFSIEDMYAFMDEFSKGIKKFSVLSGNKLSKFDLSGLNFNSYSDFIDQYVNLLQSVESQFKSFSDKGAVPQDKFNTVVNNFQRVISQYITKTYNELEATVEYFKVDDSGNISSTMPLPLKNELRDTILEVYKFLNSITEKIRQGELSIEDAEKQLDEFTVRKFNKKSSASTDQTKDTFPNTDTKLDEAVTSAKDLDKTLKQVDIPTDSFDKVLEKLDRTKSELVDIVKITKQSVSDADGKFHDSYTLKDSRGSTEIYGVNSKTDKGQILRQNIVGYDVKKDTVDNSKELLANAKNIKAEWDKNLKAIQDYMDAVTKLNNLKAKDKGTGSEANQIALQTQNVEELKQAAWDARKNLSSMQAENPDIIAWKQLVDVMELFDQASKGSAESAAKLKDALNNIKVPSLDKYENKLSSYLNKTGGYDATIARFNDGGWTSDTYLKNVQAVCDAVKQYSTLLNNIKTNQNGIASDEDIQNLDKYEKKIKETIAKVTNMSAAEKGYSQLAGQKEIDKINKILRENSAMSSKAKAKIKAYKQELISGNPSVSLEKIHGKIMKIVNAEELAGRAGRSMFDVIKEKAFYGFAAQIGMYFGFNDIVNGFKQAASTVTELNTQITELAKVSEQSSKQIYADFDSYADIAKEVRGTISDTIAATADWSKNGYSIPDAKQLAEISQLYKNVGDGIDIDTANESLISTLKGFQLEADQAEHIVDVFNKVSKNIGEVA